MKTAMREVLMESTVKPISLEPPHRCIERLVAHLQVTADIFDDNDRVVDDEAGGDGERHCERLSSV